MHWATETIGKPWLPGATGPDAFYCWGLVQWVFRTQWGVEIPNLHGERQESIRTIARQVNFGRAELPAREFDVLVMHGSVRQRHVGVMVRANGILGVLHADGHMGARGPEGCVVFHRMSDAIDGRFNGFELWRAK